MKLSLLWLWFSPLVSAFPSAPSSRLSTRGDDQIPRLAMYVQTFTTAQNESVRLLPLVKENTGVTHVIISSFHLSTQAGEIHLNDNPPNSTQFDYLWHEVKKLQAEGVKVLAMLGGAARGTYDNLSSGDPATFRRYYEPLVRLLKQYNFDGIDLDIEDRISSAVALRLIQNIRQDFAPPFSITMAPVATALINNNTNNISGFNYFELDASAVDDSGAPLVDWYNTQFYSGFGSAGTPGTYRQIIAQGWAPERVVMGVLDSASDGSGWVNTNSIVTTIQELRAQYPDFGGVSGWEYFNAGLQEGVGTEPWQWVKVIQDALYAPLSRRWLVK